MDRHDFKGWWRLGNVEHCEPLTVRDAHSRFLLAVRLPKSARYADIRVEFERLFTQYGPPKVIRSYTGSPFASVQAPLGLNRLSAWWICLRIQVDWSRPARPQDNGAHERMHRDLEAEGAQHVQPYAKTKQAAFDVWREEYNWQRPHEVLKGRTPGDVYQKSNRTMPAAGAELDYGNGFFVRKIKCLGLIAWRRERIFVSIASAGLRVGAKISSHAALKVWLNYLQVGTIDLQTSSFRAEAARLSA